MRLHRDAKPYHQCDESGSQEDNMIGEYRAVLCATPKHMRGYTKEEAALAYLVRLSRLPTVS